MAQLMSVLPPFSAHCLPSACCELMRDPNSELNDFYPPLTGSRAFKLDPNGKPPGVKWLWVPLLPFIDEKRLLSTLNRISETFTDEEKRRNTNATSCELMVSKRHPSANLESSKSWAPLPSPLFGFARTEGKIVDGVATLEYKYDDQRATPPVLTTRGTDSPVAHLDNGYSEAMRVKRGGNTRIRYPVPPRIIENALRRLNTGATNAKTGTEERSHVGRAPVCFFFRDKGHCRYGDNCRYRHEAASGKLAPRNESSQ